MGMRCWFGHDWQQESGPGAKPETVRVIRWCARVDCTKRQKLVKRRSDGLTGHSHSLEWQDTTEAVRGR